ncbi:MAG TPA: hypothetical protein VE177_04170, partial [Candidatus Binatus sp.]|nr:hypothetical protein [Candidatus Binatus sp.]
MIQTVRADNVMTPLNVPRATDDGQDPIMILWTGYAPSWWVYHNIPGWNDTSICSMTKTVRNMPSNVTLEFSDPGQNFCIGPRSHVRIWDMGTDPNLGTWSIGSMHHEHTECDPICHHV